MAPGDETSRVHHGGVSQAGGRSPRPSRDVCAEPLRLGDSLETRGVPYWGAGRLGDGVGNNIWAGRLVVAVIYSRFGKTRVCITPISLHRVKIMCSFWFSGKRTVATIVQEVVSCIVSYIIYSPFFSLLPTT